MNVKKVSEIHSKNAVKDDLIEVVYILCEQNVSVLFS